MKWAVITLTKGALSKAKEVKNTLDNVDIYALSKWSDSDTYEIKCKFKDFVGQIFHKYDTIVFIMASGIVVRVISKYIQHKAIDPAILVMDEKGQFVISLLSGHIGGANEGAKTLAKVVGGTAVITTASDVNNTMAVDTLAEKLGYKIGDYEDAKNITSLIVNREKVGIKSQSDIGINLPPNIIPNYLDKDDVKGLIIISNKRNIDVDKPKVQLIPQNIVLGIGCRKGIEGNKIINAVTKVLEELNININSIRSFATIELKKDEEGILEAVKKFNCNLEIIHNSNIEKIQHKFDTSDFVKKSVGVGAVCEPCGYISSKKGKCLLKKTSFGGITLSVWEEILNEQ